MKQIKKLALFATVALGAMSCSNNEIIETLNEQNEIRFASVQMGNGIITRANESLAGTETFGVYAFLTDPSTLEAYISDETLSKTGNIWGLSKKYYFPTGNFSMNFWAWGKDKTKNVPTSVSATGLVYTDYAVDQTKAADHEAFVISKEVKTVTQANKDAIALHFWHALSKIQFTAKIADATNFANVDAKITGIKINTSKTGSISYEGPTSKWVPSATTEDLTITLTKTDALTAKPSDVTSSFYAIPLATGGTNTITVNAVLYHKNTTIEVGTISGTITATADQLAINNSVTYNIILDLDNATGLTEIKFAEPTIEDWTPVNGGDVTLPEPMPI